MNTKTREQRPRKAVHYVPLKSYAASPSPLPLFPLLHEHRFKASMFTLTQHKLWCVYSHCCFFIIIITPYVFIFCNQISDSCGKKKTTRNQKKKNKKKHRSLD